MKYLSGFTSWIWSKLGAVLLRIGFLLLWLFARPPILLSIIIFAVEPRWSRLWIILLGGLTWWSIWEYVAARSNLRAVAGFWKDFVSTADDDWPFFSSYPLTSLIQDSALKEFEELLGRQTPPHLLRQVDNEGNANPRVLDLCAYQVIGRKGPGNKLGTIIVVPSDLSEPNETTLFKALHELGHCQRISIVVRNFSLVGSRCIWTITFWFIVFLRWNLKTLAIASALLIVARCAWWLHYWGRNNLLNDELLADDFAVAHMDLPLLRRFHGTLAKWQDSTTPFFQDLRFTPELLRDRSVRLFDHVTRRLNNEAILSTTILPMLDPFSWVGILCYFGSLTAIAFLPWNHLTYARPFLLLVPLTYSLVYAFRFTSAKISISKKIVGFLSERLLFRHISATEEGRQPAPDLIDPSLTSRLRFTRTPCAGRKVEQRRLTSLIRDSGKPVVVTGPEGIGKTTLIRRVIESWRLKFHCYYADLADAATIESAVLAILNALDIRSHTRTHLLRKLEILGEACLVLDNLDRVIREDKERFFTFIAELNQLSSLRLVLVGREASKIVMDHCVLEVGPLPAEAADEVILESTNLKAQPSPADLEHIRSFCHGSPSLLKLCWPACLKGFKLNLNDVEVALDVGNQHNGSGMIVPLRSFVWNSGALSPNAKRLLAVLARFPQGLPRQVCDRMPGLELAPATEELRSLTGLLTDHGNPTLLQISQTMRTPELADHPGEPGDILIVLDDFAGMGNGTGAPWSEYDFEIIRMLRGLHSNLLAAFRIAAELEDKHRTKLLASLVLSFLRHSDADLTADLAELVTCLKDGEQSAARVFLVWGQSLSHLNGGRLQLAAKTALEALAIAEMIGANTLHNWIRLDLGRILAAQSNFVEATSYIDDARSFFLAENDRQGVGYAFLLSGQCLSLQRRAAAQVTSLLLEAVSNARVCGDAALLAHAQFELARLEYESCSYDQAQTFIDAASQFYQSGGDSIRYWTCQLLRGKAFALRGDRVSHDLQNARDAFQEALQGFRLDGYIEGEGQALLELAQLSFREGDLDAADEFASQSIELYLRTDRSDWLIKAKILRGRILVARKQNDPAELYLKSALLESRKLLDLSLEGACLEAMGEGLEAMGEFEAAKAHYQNARTAFESNGDSRGFGYCNVWLGRLEAANDGFDRACALFDKAIAIGRELYWAPLESLALTELGKTHYRHGNPNRASELLMCAIERLYDAMTPSILAECCRFLGAIHSEKGEIDEAERFLKRALENYPPAGWDWQRAKSEFMLGSLYYSGRAWLKARTKLSKAAELFVRADDSRMAAIALEADGDAALKVGPRQVASAQESYRKALKMTDVLRQIDVGRLHYKSSKLSTDPEEAERHRLSARVAWTNADRKDLFEGTDREELN